MNPPSLRDYKAEAYNLGSPSPAPIKPLNSLSAFPKARSTSTSKIPGLKVKLDFGKGRKRSRPSPDDDSDELGLLESPPKRLKMNKEEMTTLLRDMFKEHEEKNAQSNSALLVQVREIKTHLQTETDARKEMDTRLEN